MSSFQEDIQVDKEADIPDQTICQSEDMNNAFGGEEKTKQVCEDDEVTQGKTDFDSEKVFPDSRITVGSFMILLMTFVVKYSLTGVAVTELLQLLDLLCPSENLLVKSLTAFKKWFEHVKHPLIVHYYCSFCQIGLSDINVLAECPNESCRKKLNEASISHFIEIPVAEHIKSFFARPTFKKDIRHRFSRGKKSQNSIEDIYDGYIYQNLSKTGGILENENNLSLVWNTDGIPCFKSSNLSLWPLFFQINELQYNKRINPENMILGGLWLGPKKPTMISYTEPFIKTLQKLETEGIEIKSNLYTFTCKVIVIAGSADLPAKSIICNTMQFNGKYGCSKCLQPGETCKTSEKGHCHVFPFKAENPCGPKRSHAGCLEDVNTAVQNNTICRGIKGPSFLQCLTCYDLVEGTCIDYMHGILLGVTKLLLSLWFLPEHNSKAFSLATFVGLIDKRLKNIKPPNNITRLPRSIKDHLKYWKASEFRSWLLYYSLPVLRDIQSEDYFQHYLLFVNAIFILLQDSIMPVDIDRSESILKHFCCLFAALYGDRYMTCNVHQLLHLPEMVRQMGPLWAYSCFSFENANGNILKFFNGTQNVDFQIVETISLMQALPILQKKYIDSESPEDILLKTLKGTLNRQDHFLEDNIYVVGGTGKKRMSVSELEAVSQFLGHVPVHYVTFNRIRIGNEILHSRNYKRVHARNSYTVVFKKPDGSEHICQIAFYIQLFPFCEKHHGLQKLCKCNVVNVAVVNQFLKHNDAGLQKLSNDTLTGADVAFIHILQPLSLQNCCIVPV